MLRQLRPVQFLESDRFKRNTILQLLLGKSRLAPLKIVSIPRLELVSATMATKVNVSLRNNFGSSLSESVFLD